MGFYKYLAKAWKTAFLPPSKSKLFKGAKNLGKVAEWPAERADYIGGILAPMQLVSSKPPNRPSR